MNIPIFQCPQTFQANISVRGHPCLAAHSVCQSHWCETERTVCLPLERYTRLWLRFLLQSPYVGRSATHHLKNYVCCTTDCTPFKIVNRNVWSCCFLFACEMPYQSGGNQRLSAAQFSAVFCPNLTDILLLSGIALSVRLTCCP